MFYSCFDQHLCTALLENSCQIKLKYPAASVFLACNCNNCNCSTSNRCRKLAVANPLWTGTFFPFEFLSGLPAIVGMSADFLSPWPGLLPALNWMFIVPPLQSTRLTPWGCWVQPAWPALKGTTAPSFMHHTASDNNTVFIDHLYVSGTLQTQCAFPLAVQLWASNQSSLSLLPHVQNGDSISRVLPRIVTGPQKRSRVKHVAQNLAHSQPLIKCQLYCRSTVSTHDFIWFLQQLCKESLIMSRAHIYLVHIDTAVLVAKTIVIFPSCQISHCPSLQIPLSPYDPAAFSAQVLPLGSLPLPSLQDPETTGTGTGTRSRSAGGIPDPATFSRFYSERWLAACTYFIDG